MSVSFFQGKYYMHINDFVNKKSISITEDEFNKIINMAHEIKKEMKKLRAQNSASKIKEKKKETKREKVLVISSDDNQSDEDTDMD